MESYELLKQEIQNQKTAIENKGGVVNVANLNPSPAEITAGINSIEFPDFSSATATEDDVFVGKTFYAGDNGLKTGKNKFTNDYIEAMLLNKQLSNTIDYKLPDGTTTLRNYTFFGNPNDVNFTFNEDIETISIHAFNGANFNFTNFNSLRNLKVLDQYCFANNQLRNIDLSNLPSCIETFGLGVFRNSVYANAQIRFPANLSSVAAQTFYCEERAYPKDIDFSNYHLTTLTSNMLYNLMFDCDLIVPEGVTEIASYFNYNGCFHNIEFPSTLTTIGNYAFGSANTSVASDFYLKTITFKGETPPSITRTAFSTLHLQNNVKIYVPDNAVDAYKAVSNISSFKNNIYPVSQKV